MMRTGPHKRSNDQAPASKPKRRRTVAKKPYRVDSEPSTDVETSSQEFLPITSEYLRVLEEQFTSIAVSLLNFLDILLSADFSFSSPVIRAPLALGPLPLTSANSLGGARTASPAPSAINPAAPSASLHRAFYRFKTVFKVLLPPPAIVSPRQSLSFLS